MTRAAQGLWLAVLVALPSVRADGIADRCAACHGAEGIATVAGVPNLAGQKRGYLLAQLRAFGEGARADPAMARAVAGLDDATLAQLASHYAALPAPTSRPPAADAPGRNAAAVCAPCHGALGRSGNDEWPNLAGQHADYLRAQLQAYRDGQRHHPIMSRVAGTLDPASIESVSGYFEHLAGAAPARR